MSTHKAIHDLLEEARLFVRFLETETPQTDSLEPLIDRYLDFKAVSARALRVITDAGLVRDDCMLDAVLERLESELRSRLAGVLPLEVVTVRRYGHTHRKLYEYLWTHRGTPVTATRLRVLTGDQVHTERRVRELRDIGLRIEAARRSGQNVYVLTDDDFDVEIALQRFVPQFVSAVHDWTPARRRLILEQLGLA